MEMCTASLSFISDLPLYSTEKPFNLEDASAENGRISNLVFETRDDVEIRNARCSGSHDFSLESTGFEWITRPSSVNIPHTLDEFIQEYLEEAVGIVQSRFQPAKVIAYDCRTRVHKSKEEIHGDRADRTTPLVIAPDVHVDHTLDGAWRRIMRHLTEDEAVKMLGDEWRVRIVNLWRPLYHPVKDSALAVCDYRSVRFEDLLTADHVNASYVGEIYYLKFHREQKWYWLREQTPDELTLFVSFDSEEGEHARFCPHAAFQDPTTSGHIPIRESVEVRCIVFTRRDV